MQGTGQNTEYAAMENLVRLTECAREKHGNETGIVAVPPAASSMARCLKEFEYAFIWFVIIELNSWSHTKAFIIL